MTEPTRFEFYNIEVKVKSKDKVVILEAKMLDSNKQEVIFEFHYGDPEQLMNMFLLLVEEMSKVFPDFEGSKLWKDDEFK